jgi:hypothetical protein
VLSQRTSVGLDVHARSVVACGLDRETGEVLERRLTPDHREILEWIGGLRAPVAVTYEAGPTGFGLARALAGAEITCAVAAPSKLIRPPGDRVKTDARDAALLARLLHLGEIVAVTVPSVVQKAARDLVRAREDCRADLMRCRHRVSNRFCSKGLSTMAVTLGRWLMNGGCVNSPSIVPGWGRPTRRRSMPYWHRWIVASVWMRRSWHWLGTASSPRSFSGWAASRLG